MNTHNKKIVYVTLVGAPNVGKSSLVNYLTNFHACTVSSKGHTTKESVYAVINIDNCQIVFIDTPGLSKENNGIYQKYNTIVQTECNITQNNHAHVLLFLFEAHRSLPIHLHGFIDKHSHKNKIAVMTKFDKPHKDKYLENTTLIKDYFDDIFVTSNITGKGMNDVLKSIMSYAQEEEWHYPETFKTSLNINTIIKEKIRESLFEYLYKEIPHEVGIEFGVRDDNIYDVTLYCTLSQKPIILNVIKDISIAARHNVQKILNKKIHLYMYVKVDN